MAAMAPALTDAPAEAHHIRFKLAPPTSTLSPGSVENNSNILISSNGAVKRKAIVSASEDCSIDFRANNKKEEQQHTEASACPLGKLQPLVASYLCSDVTSVPSTKESLKLQGILPSTYFNSSDFLPRKHQTLERCGEQLKNLMSNSNQPVASPHPQVPVNGIAKKLAKPSPDRDCMTAVNGGRSLVTQDSLSEEANNVFFQGNLSGRALLKGEMEQQPPAGVSRDTTNNPELPATPVSDTCTSPGVPGRPVTSSVTPTARLSQSTMNREGSEHGSLGTPSTSPARQQAPSLSSFDVELRERTQLSQSRHCEIESRLRRLRKRLQVVQAKQVERHVQQQLGGFLQTTFSKLPSLDTLRQRSPAVLTRKAEAALWLAASDPAAEDGLSQFLKSGSVHSELERLSLSGTANLRIAENAFDSDVTESSSGGETDVEEDELVKAEIEQRHISLWRRAEGRYSVERASIISHWNWLQAQISDLEYRIRQQTDIYRQIRANKGSIELGDSAPSGMSVQDGVDMMVEPIGCKGAQDGVPVGVEGVASAYSPAVDPNPWKGCAPGRQVNGVVNSTCVAARTRPVLSCKKRRLVRPSNVAGLNRKVERTAGSRCNCEVNPLCAICSSRSTHSMPFQYERPLLERLSQFDPCIHPILSFTDDVSMNLHLQRVMKSHWQNRPLEKTKPPKKLSLKHKISLSGHLQEPSSSKEKHRLTSSLLATVRLSHHKVRPEKQHRQQLDNLLNASRLDGRPLCKPERGMGLSPAAYDRSHSRKRPREYSMERTDTTPRLFMDTGSPCSSLTSLHTPTHSPLMRQLSTSSESSTPLGPSSQSATTTPQPIRRRRGESSFDINNIVIPMSVAATTRVEKLQYKEILTPSWREVDICAQPIAEEDEVVEIEDLSDAAFARLHLPCEEHERSRWTWVASAPAKRRGSRSYKSLDGRTTPLLGSTNPSTPQPASPDTLHFHMLQDYGLVPSPHSPVSPDVLSNPHTPGSRDSHRLQSSEDTRCSTPDFNFEELMVQPWERRCFPLADDPTMEPEDQIIPDVERPGRGFRRIPGSKMGSSKSESENGPSSPLSDDSSKQKPHPH